MKTLWLIFLLCLFSLSLLAQERYGPYKVSKFVDGDTFWVRVSPEKDLKVTLIGIYTPEVKWRGLTEEQPGGKEALLNWILSKKATFGNIFLNL